MFFRITFLFDIENLEMSDLGYNNFTTEPLVMKSVG